jgi:hypothetical protein
MDADCDRSIDLFVANGHVTQMPAEDWAQQSSLLRGSADGFQEAGDIGRWFDAPWHARGASRVDLNDDGLDDLVVSLIDTPAALLLNNSLTVGNRIQLHLIGTQSCRSAEGTLIEVETASGKTTHIMARNAGYLSSNSSAITIGLGDDKTIDRLRIHWPGGATQDPGPVTSGKSYTVIQGRQGLVN